MLSGQKCVEMTFAVHCKKRRGSGMLKKNLIKSSKLISTTYICIGNEVQPTVQFQLCGVSFWSKNITSKMIKPRLHVHMYIKHKMSVQCSYICTYIQKPHVDCSAELIWSEMTPKMRWQAATRSEFVTDSTLNLMVHRLPFVVVKWFANYI